MKIFHSTFALTTFFSLITTAQAAFIDVPSNQANYEAINYVQGKKIVQGYSDGSFRPDNEINRAELTKIIMATSLNEAEIAACNKSATALSDVSAEVWFAPYVCAAKVRGVIKGYDDQTFKPAQSVTFVEAAKIISLGLGQNLAEDTELWYRPYVNYLSSRSAIPSTVNEVAKNITRGEMAEMIYRLHAAVQNRPAQAFVENQLQPMTEEIKAQQVAQASADTATSPTPSPSIPNTSGSRTPADELLNDETPLPINNPMICQACPAGTIGQPGNNCACETAYLFEQTYPLNQCESTDFICGEGYEYFTNPEQCGCKLQTEVLNYWLVSDAQFKVNTLDEKPSVAHGTYQVLDAQSLDAALGKKNLVLFFHAAWCPSCAALDQEIKERITELPEDAIIFKTDYDTETKLREKFEITSQHSMVIIDKNNALQFKQAGVTFNDIITVLEKLALPTTTIDEPGA